MYEYWLKIYNPKDWDEGGGVGGGGVAIDFPEWKALPDSPCQPARPTLCLILGPIRNHMAWQWHSFPISYRPFNTQNGGGGGGYSLTMWGVNQRLTLRSFKAGSIICICPKWNENQTFSKYQITQSIALFAPFLSSYCWRCTDVWHRASSNIEWFNED